MPPETATDTQTMVDSLADYFGEVPERDALGEFFKNVGKDFSIKRINTAAVDALIDRVDKVISMQMDAIIHHPDFQVLESAWRGLSYLVENTKFSAPVKIEVLDTSKEELYEDLENAKSEDGYLNSSALWQHVYWGAYDKVGGHPYTAAMLNYQFDASPADIKLMRHLCVLGESASLPFLGNASAKFFGDDNFEQVLNNRNLEMQVKEGAKYTAWHTFRDEENSKYMSLALPRFLGRLPYGKELEETKRFNYSETIAEKGTEKGKIIDHSLYLNASFAMAANMVRGFEESGWSVKIVGVDSGGRVENLPVPIIEGQAKVPMEASVGETKDQELTDMGFQALAHWDRTDYACFFDARTVKRARDLKDKQQKANEIVGIGMQYMLLVTRIGHFLKYRQLRYVGKNAGAAEIQKSLDDWLITLVADQPNPQDEVVARKPLRSYKLEVRELEDRPGFFEVTLELRPHVAIVGFDIRLQLVAYHSGGEKK